MSFFTRRRNLGKKSPTHKPTIAKKKQMSKKKMAIILASTLAAAVAIGMHKQQLMTLVQNAFGKKPKHGFTPFKRAKQWSPESNNPETRTSEPILPSQRKKKSKKSKKSKRRARSH